MKSLIPAAMKRKYGVNCSKTKDGLGIDKWESGDIPKPTRAQVVIDVAEHEAYLATQETLEAQAQQDIEDELAKSDGDTFKILKAQRVLGLI